MNMPNLLALRPTRRPGRQPRSGFALIISLSLMTLLLLLVLTLSILVRLELQTAQGSLYTEQARQNALLAAYIGIGQLQKFAGPDQRITTTADIGRQRDIRDHTTDQIGPDTRNIGMVFPYVTSTPEGAFLNIPPPYGFPSYVAGGTIFWTMVWGHGTTPLSIYTGQDTNGHVSPSAVLLNYLVSGDEGTPLTFSPNGVVTSPDKIIFTSTTGDTKSGIHSQNTPDATKWSSLTTDIQIKPSAGNSTDYAPAVLLVGPGTALTNATLDQVIHLYPGYDTSKPQIRDSRPGVSQVVAPMVNINIPDESSTRTVGRYAYWVGDEGVKAKYNLPDPYAGADKKGNITESTQAAQAIRYRLGAVQRNGIERMAANASVALDSYSSGNTAGVNNPSFYNPAAAAQLSQVLDQPQVQLIDRQVKGFLNVDDSSEVLRLHFHDYTTYSYGVLADTLRGGLRYDLTAAFEPGPNSDAVFTGDGANNTLKGRAILPPSVSAPASLTTEPFAGNLGLKNRADNSSFHGPAAPDFGNTTHPGLKWDVLQSWYRISANNTGTAPVPMQAGNSTTAGISPVILQARLKFGETVDNQQFQYVAVEPLFVLANPYNFPITPPTGGLDLGFRINTATGWEWGFHAIARNADRRDPHGSGVGVYVGFDNTQNTTLASAFTASGGSNVMTNGYNNAYFYPSTAVSPITPVVSGVTYGGGGGGIGVRPGYFPFLKNPASYSLFISSMPGSAGAQGNSRFNSVLDQVAFHIPKFINGQQIIWQPGEAIVFTLADETTGGRNLTSQFQPLTSRYNQLSTSLRKITAVVGTVGATNGLYSLQVNQVVPVPLKPGTISDNVHYFMLRYTGIKTAGDTLRSYADSSGTVIPSSWNLTLGNNTLTTNITAYGNDPARAWPDPQYGYISTAWPSVSATLELRYDNTAPYASVPTIASDGGTLPSLANVTTTAYSTGISPGGGTTPMAAPGTNVLQTITNFDLSGAGISGHTYVPGVGDPAGYLPPNPPQGYRRQFLGSGSGTTVPTLTNGVLPVFLTSYVMSMALPGSMDPMYFAKDAAPTADAGSNTFDPNMQVSYRTYMDFNIRAVNLSLPPTAPLNPATTNPSQTVNTAAFITAPPFGRVWNQGPAIGGGAGDDVVQASYNPLDDTSFNSKNASPNFSTFNPSKFLGNFYNAPWGNSLSAGTVGNGTTGPYSGQQYNILFALPMRFNAGQGGSIANIPNPNTNALMPDIPIMSLGQLQHADVTADDVWVSVGYQRANAIGNSYWTPFVNRNSSMQMKPSQSGLVTRRVSSVSGNNTTYSSISSASSLGVYDISYLLNCALFDRYFFSTLAQFQRSTTVPANARLKYAAGIIPDISRLGLGSSAITVIDPVTGGTMFRAYAPARYMMIDGAFNVNSTSFEAWRAILSGMRHVALSRYGGTVDDSGNPSSNGRLPVVYTPRVMPSSFLGNATINSPSTYMTGSFVYQPIKAGQASAAFSHDTNEPTGKDAASYAGFRQLTDADIDYLAMKIIQQVRARGPFLSLAQFVNRRLSPPTSNHPQPYNDPLSWAGALQTAIDLNTNSGPTTNSNSLNNFYLAMVNNGSNPTSPLAINSSLLPVDSKNGAGSNQTYPEGPTPFGQSPYPSGSADPNSRLVGIPGWLTQADLLEALAPILSVRSDTFIVRTYGEVISPQTSQHEADLVLSIAQDPSKILGRAWCEVVVQRVPDYIATDTASLNEPSATTGLNAPNPSVGGKVSPILSPVNIAFGRRFKIVSVRWLNAGDI